MRDDIAGSVESIAQITPEILYACTDAFYRPQNMVLAVAGNVTMDEVLAACARADIPVKTARWSASPPPRGRTWPSRTASFPWPWQSPCWAWL